MSRNKHKKEIKKNKKEIKIKYKEKKKDKDKIKNDRLSELYQQQRKMRNAKNISLSPRSLELFDGQWNEPKLVKNLTLEMLERVTSDEIKRRRDGRKAVTKCYADRQHSDVGKKPI